MNGGRGQLHLRHTVTLFIIIFGLNLDLQNSINNKRQNGGVMGGHDDAVYGLVITGQALVCINN